MDFLRRLFQPALAEGGGAPPTPSPLGAVFKVLWRVGVVGLVLLTVQALGQDGTGAKWRYLFIGGLTAIVALGAGGLLGLIFGMPQSSKVVVAPAASTGAGAETGPTADWYQDSSSLENIATALTTALITLTLVNFKPWAAEFDVTAAAIAASMEGRTVADRDASTAHLIQAREALAELAQAKNDSAKDFAARRKERVEAVDVAAAEAARAGAEASAVGGLLLGAYALLGFLASYLWTRRYLSAELASGRSAMRGVIRSDAQDAAKVDLTRLNKLAQVASKAVTDPEAAAAAVAAFTAALKAGPANLIAPLPPVDPGLVQDDPWKGQFGGMASNAIAEIAAKVREVSGKHGLFLVVLTVRGRDAASSANLAGSTARLYLHPTFPEPIIRPLDFDGAGVAQLTLSAVGAFTVGVQFLPGDQRLELDLSNLPDAPPAFRLN